jgi:hypothetical protein
MGKLRSIEYVLFKNNNLRHMIIMMNFMAYLYIDSEEEYWENFVGINQIKNYKYMNNVL